MFQNKNRFYLSNLLLTSQEEFWWNGQINRVVNQGNYPSRHSYLKRFKQWSLYIPTVLTFEAA